MTVSRRLSGAAVAAVLMLQTGTANALCITRTETRSAALFLAPDIFRAVATRCRASLPADAYLSRSGEALASRYRAASSAAWPGVQALLGRIPEVKMFRGLNEDGARGLIGAMLEDKALGKIAPGDCALASDMLASLDPLPPENMASFLITLITLAEMKDRGAKPAGGEKKPAKAPLLCPAT